MEANDGSHQPIARGTSRCPLRPVDTSCLLGLFLQICSDSTTPSFSFPGVQNLALDVLRIVATDGSFDTTTMDLDVRPLLLVVPLLSLSCTTCNRNQCRTLAICGNTMVFGVTTSGLLAVVPLLLQLWQRMFSETAGGNPDNMKGGGRRASAVMMARGTYVGACLLVLIMMLVLSLGYGDDAPPIHLLPLWSAAPKNAATSRLTVQEMDAGGCLAAARGCPCVVCMNVRTMYRLRWQLRT